MKEGDHKDRYCRLVGTRRLMTETLKMSLPYLHHQPIRKKSTSGNPPSKCCLYRLFPDCHQGV